MAVVNLCLSAKSCLSLVSIFVVLLRNTVSQMVYKHAISTIVPARNVKMPMNGDDSTGNA